MDDSNNNVLQFCSVTGANEAVAKQLLEACGGNLELAINMHMESSGAATGQSTGNSDVDAVRAPIPQTQEVLVDDIPAYATFRGRKRKMRSVFDGFRDFQEEARQQEEELLAGASGSRTSRKTRTLQDLFRPPVDITYKGTFANARETGKSQGKWLMVNIQNVQEFPCQALNRDVWSNSAVKAIVKDNFIFWQVYHDSDEGQRYCQFYKVDSWPYIAVLDPQTGENMIVWNKIESVTFCDLVAEFLTRHPTKECLSPVQTTSKRVRREDSLMDATEDDQLEAAIKASLINVSEPASKKQTEFGSDSNASDSDLETFTDSDDEDESSPSKRKHFSHQAQTKAQRNISPKHSPKKNSEVEVVNDGNDQSPLKKRNLRSISPLAGSSLSVDETKRTPRKCSPQRFRTNSPTTVTITSPKKCSPLRKQSPKKVNTPQKSESIHNEVHPAVLENIRRNSVSEETEKCAPNDKEASEQSDENESESPSQSVIDNRDYKEYLGPETDEKTTLMLRLPDGSKERLCISFTSQLLALVLFVNSKGFSSERYELIAQFPRRQLSQLEHSATLRDIGFHAQETIFVQARS